VNGHIVPLTTELENGVQVEILTTNNSAPSRDWLNPNLGYIASNRTRSKIKTWFRQQDYEQNIIDGKAAIDRELKRMHILTPDIDKSLKHFKVKTEKEWQAKVGRGDITSGQLTHGLNQVYSNESVKPIPTKPKLKKKLTKGSTQSINVSGVGNLLTKIAPCCKPVPGDDIIGFITRGQGVSIHRKDCTNILNLENEKIDRLIEVEWGGDLEATYPVSIHITAVDRQGLLRDVSKVLADDKVDVIGVNTLSDKDEQMAQMSITVEISDLQQLSRIMDKLAQLQNVIDVGRERVRS